MHFSKFCCNEFIKLIFSGASIQYQTLHQKNKGLFQKAIAQSGNAAPNWAVNAPEDAWEMTLKFAKSVGCTAQDKVEVLKCLKSKSTEELLQGSVYGRVSTLVFQQIQFYRSLLTLFFSAALHR